MKPSFFRTLVRSLVYGTILVIVAFCYELYTSSDIYTARFHKSVHDAEHELLNKSVQFSHKCVTCNTNIIDLVSYFGCTGCEKSQYNQTHSAVKLENKEINHKLQAQVNSFMQDAYTTYIMQCDYHLSFFLSTPFCFPARELAWVSFSVSDSQRVHPTSFFLSHLVGWIVTLLYVYHRRTIASDQKQTSDARLATLMRKMEPQRSSEKDSVDVDVQVASSRAEVPPPPPSSSLSRRSLSRPRDDSSPGCSLEEQRMQM